MKTADKSKPAKFGIFKTLGAMLGLAVLLSYATFLIAPALERIGLSYRATHTTLPRLFLGIGAAWGLTMYFSQSARAAFLVVLVPFIMGVMGWFVALFLGGFLIFFGLPEFAADRLPPAGFVVGAVCGAFLSIFGAIELIDSLRGKRRQTSAD